jgi:hypothetical protein
VSDQLGPIERVQPSALPQRVKRERERPDDGRGRGSQADEEAAADDGEQGDDGLPHVDVRA